jgi:predicted phosphodiesterase
MRIAVFGDVHSDSAALRRLFESANKESIDRYVCLGDIVHHNSIRGRAESDDCVTIMERHGTLSVVGNHDRLMAEDHSGFCTPQTAAYLGMLPGMHLLEDALFTHEPLMGTSGLVPREIEFDALQHERNRIGFFGHTHKRVLFSKTEEGRYLVYFFPRFGFDYDVSNGLHLINPGTVCPHRLPYEPPSYVVYDSDRQTVQFKRIMRG